MLTIFLFCFSIHIAVTLKEEVETVKGLWEQKEREAEQWKARAQIAEERLAKYVYKTC